MAGAALHKWYSDPKVSYSCAMPSCRIPVVFGVDGDRPAPGWAHVTLRRYSKKGCLVLELMFCPEHTVVPGPRKMELPGVKP